MIGKCWYREGQERQYTEHDNGHHTVQAEREAERLSTILRHTTPIFLLTPQWIWWKYF